MSAELYTLPDGRYVLPLWLYRRCSNKRVGWLDDKFGNLNHVRVHILKGIQHQSNYNSDREGRSWYKMFDDGRDAARGHTHIDTFEQLQAVCHDLPYSWRL